MRAFDYPAGYRGNWHRHRLGQIVYPLRGVATIDTDVHHVTVAPHRAYAVHPWRPHRVSAVGNTSLRSVFFDPRSQLASELEFGIRRVDELLHELIRRAARELDEPRRGSVAEQIETLLVALLIDAPKAMGYVELPRVTHPRLSGAFESVWEAGVLPPLRVSDVAARCHLSERQFRRLFQENTGLRFTDWRSLARVKVAAESIARGRSITRAADDVGLSSPSALGDIFKRYTGLTPSEFLRLNA